MSDGRTWTILVTPTAERDLKRLPPKDQARVRAAIDSLAAGPGHSDLRKLQGRDDEWRLRVGDLRLRLRFDFPARVVVILRVLPRGQAYRE